jgi:hypothetical protein
MAVQRANHYLAGLAGDFETQLIAGLPISSSGGNFYRDYYSVPEYWKTRRLIPEDALELAEPVVGIRVESELQQRTAVESPSATSLVISYRSERNGTWKPLVDLEPVDRELGLSCLFHCVVSYVRTHAKRRGNRPALGSKEPLTLC